MAKPALPVTADTPIAPGSDGMSISDEEMQQETHSLPPSLTDYPVHWGRTYHKFQEGSYHFPNDEEEKARLDGLHAILNHYFNGRLFFSPLDRERTKMILDIGTGTGLWCIELSDANSFPHAHITGIDLSPIQPVMVPNNVSFELQDCADIDWCRPLGSIDFIHSRFMAGSLESYKALIRNSKRYLKPGEGWLELHEIHSKPACDDGTMPEDWKFAEWESKLNYSSTNKIQPPRPFRIAENLNGWMQAAGYVDVTELRYKIPLSAWPRDPRMKKIGERYGQNWYQGLPAFSYKLFGPEGYGDSRDEVELMLVDVRKALKQKNIHAYMLYHVIYGRCPAPGER